MKNLILLAFLLIAEIGLAQQRKDTIGLNVPYKNNEIIYEKVFTAPGKTADQLFANAQLWFVKRYKNFNNIQIQDDVIRRVVGRGDELLTVKVNGIFATEAGFHTNVTVQIDCKENRYRVRVFNAVIETEGAEKTKNFVYAEQLMEPLVLIPTRVTAPNNQNVFSKNQSKKALQNLNLLVGNVMDSINQSMNDNDNF